jgi:hypothetical protein
MLILLIKQREGRAHNRRTSRAISGDFTELPQGGKKDSTKQSSASANRNANADHKEQHKKIVSWRICVGCEVKDFS